MSERIRALQAWDEVPFVGMDNEALLLARVNGEAELRRLAAQRDVAAVAFWHQYILDGYADDACLITIKGDAK